MRIVSSLSAAQNHAKADVAGTRVAERPPPRSGASQRQSEGASLLEDCFGGAEVGQAPYRITARRAQGRG